MKTATTSLFALILIALIAACTSAPKQEQHTSDAVQEKAKAPQTPLPHTQASIKDDRLNAVYEQYQLLTDALVSGDGTSAKVAAAAIEVGSKDISGASALTSLASKITMAGSLDDQRAAFSLLSTEFITLLKKTGINSGELYIAHCPMASNDTGADWVTTNKEIRNPYFGAEMLTCGSIRETINKNN